MAIHPLAGQPAPIDVLIDLPALEHAYYANRPDPADPRQRVAFGTSGHRGTPPDGTFTEAHILAITQAICDYRRDQGIDGPLFLGKDTHALSGPGPADGARGAGRQRVETVIQRDDGFTPTPVISHAILVYNRGRTRAPRRRDRHHAVAQPARRRRLQVQPAQRRPRRHRRHRVDPGPRQRAAPRRQRRASSDCPSRRRSAPPRRAQHRFRPALRRRPGERHRHGRHRGGRPQAGRRPARRRRGALLGADRRDLRPGHHRHQSGVRPDLPVHDGRPRRQDPHGLLQPLRDGQPGQAQGPLRRRLRQRPRLRPARHRHAARWA